MKNQRYAEVRGLRQTITHHPLLKCPLCASAPGMSAPTELLEAPDALEPSLCSDPRRNKDHCQAHVSNHKVSTCDLLVWDRDALSNFLNLVLAWRATTCVLSALCVGALMSGKSQQIRRGYPHHHHGCPYPHQHQQQPQIVKHGGTKRTT